MDRGLECHVDADFAGGWSSGDTQNPEAMLSRTGFVISYDGCPIYWASKLQTEIALSTTEAEYIAPVYIPAKEVMWLVIMFHAIILFFYNSSEERFQNSSVSEGV